MRDHRIDIVMPTASKDASRMEGALRGILENCREPIGSIYVISPERFLSDSISGKRIHWIPDADFPFLIEDIRAIFRRKGGAYQNASWYYQQLLKFYAFSVIGGLGDRILILDSDYVFIRPVNFLDEDGRAMLAYGYPFQWRLGTEKYSETIEHVHADFAQRLIPGWRPMHPWSGMQHHMLFERSIIRDLFDSVEREWKKDFWKAFIENVRTDKWNAAAEYVIYHHFALWKHKQRVALRHLDAVDFIFDSESDGPKREVLEKFSEEPENNAIGSHGFLQLRERLSTMDYIPSDLKNKMLHSGKIVFRLELRNGALNIA